MIKLGESTTLKVVRQIYTFSDLYGGSLKKSTLFIITTREEERLQP